ncbi:site-specific integrase [Pseudomonas aeruginosa]|nr:site-specific integrase [Pseudomonas aeruginosa]
MDSCEWAAKTNFRRSRDRCMLVLLADTGIRREELTWIRVSDVVGASADRKLPVRTSKRKGNPYRLIPISDETFRMLLEYIDVTRSIQVRRLNRRKIGFKDQGWLFCTREGSRWRPQQCHSCFVISGQRRVLLSGYLLTCLGTDILHCRSWLGFDL